MEVDRDTARDAARNELEKPRYEKSSPVGKSHNGEQWEQRPLEQDDLKIPSIPHLDYQPSERGDTPAVLITLIFIIVLAIVGATVAYRLYHHKTLWKKKKKVIFSETEEKYSSSQEHRQRAEHAASEGDWALAIAENMRSIVKNLHESDVVPLMPSCTAIEFAHLAGRALPELEQEFLFAARSFDSVVYGTWRGSSHHYEHISQLIRLIPDAVAVHKEKNSHQPEDSQSGEPTSTGQERNILHDPYTMSHSGRP